jgi:hypothetical protein
MEEPLRQEWIIFWRNMIDALKDNAHWGQPLGVVFQINKVKRELTILVEKPGYFNSRNYHLNRRCIEACGYTHVRPDDVPVDVELFRLKLASLDVPGAMILRDQGDGTLKADKNYPLKPGNQRVRKQKRSDK